jgi:hypothetical protein
MRGREVEGYNTALKGGEGYNKVMKGGKREGRE